MHTSNGISNSTWVPYTKKKKKLHFIYQGISKLISSFITKINRTLMFVVLKYAKHLTKHQAHKNMKLRCVQYDQSP